MLRYLFCVNYSFHLHSPCNGTVPLQGTCAPLWEPLTYCDDLNAVCHQLKNTTALMMSLCLLGALLIHVIYFDFVNVPSFFFNLFFLHPFLIFFINTYYLPFSVLSTLPAISISSDSSILSLKDLDKTQTEIMRHHTSISELKRSFMESVPEPRPSEWDKRLSTNSPFRTANINGQLQSVSATT